MNNLNEVKENKKTARIAGLWYLVLAIGAGYTWMYITKTFVPENAVLTVQNILATENQYILSILLSIAGQTGFIFLVLTLYRLLKNVNQTQARLMLSFVLISVSISFVNIIFQTGALVFLNRADYITAFTTGQIHELATLFLQLNIYGVYVVTLFWGLWLFPLAYLVYKSNFFPKIIAILLVLSGICYCIGSLTPLISPTCYARIATILSIPETIGEVTMLLWLLIKGVSNKKMN